MAGNPAIVASCVGDQPRQLDPHTLCAARLAEYVPLFAGTGTRHPHIQAASSPRTGPTILRSHLIGTELSFGKGGLAAGNFRLLSVVATSLSERFAAKRRLAAL